MRVRVIVDRTSASKDKRMIARIRPSLDDGGSLRCPAFCRRRSLAGRCRNDDGRRTSTCARWVTGRAAARRLARSESANS
eukprot:scaffold764_cov408-Prasinococcus_capsulatus_cf.AAC.12